MQPSDPIELLPDPIIPKNTRFSFDFISFFIEKTQICLNLKLTKVICNLIKTQVREEPILLGNNYKIYYWSCIVILGLVFFINKVDFPAPKKEIEKIIPNENFKIVK